MAALQTQPLPPPLHRGAAAPRRAVCLPATGPAHNAYVAAMQRQRQKRVLLTQLEEQSCSTS
jgi:hypothetical protein